MAHDSDKNADADSPTIPLLEESIIVSTRLVEGDTVTVQTRVEESVQHVHNLLRNDVVMVERIPIGREVVEAPQVREEDGITIIPVVREVLHIEKRLVLVEEIRITRQLGNREHHQDVTLRTLTAAVTRVPKREDGAAG